MKKQTASQDRTLPQADSVTERIHREVSDTEIAMRAYQIYQSRGGEDGADLDDWLQAERELTEQPSVIHGMAKGAA
jgi:hypothetical protein